MAEERKKLQPPYYFLSSDDKAKLGYLTIKRIAINIYKNQSIKKVFDINKMKEAYQWFDLEHEWGYFNNLWREYFQERGMRDDQDAWLYSLTDFLVWHINYQPNRFSQVISCHIKSNNLSKKEIIQLNQIFSPAGFFYKDGFFYSSTFNPEIKVKISDFLSVRLKNIDQDLYNTWSSITEDIVSNNKDKATTISAKSRKVLNGLLRKLSPDLVLIDQEQGRIKKRLAVILKNRKQEEIIGRISSLITTLNQTQAKGDHEFIDENTAIFTFQITELIIFLILSHSM